MLGNLQETFENSIAESDEADAAISQTFSLLGQAAKRLNHTSPII